MHMDWRLHQRDFPGTKVGKQVSQLTLASNMATFLEAALPRPESDKSQKRDDGTSLQIQAAKGIDDIVTHAPSLSTLIGFQVLGMSVRLTTYHI